MSPKLEEMLLKWEQMRKNGKPVALDSLCKDSPELRDELLAQVTALEKMDRLLNLSKDEPSGIKSERRRTRFDDLQPRWEPIAGYRLEKRLGKGGFGEVWKAIGPGGFAVALKFVSLSGQLSASELR